MNNSIKCLEEVIKIKGSEWKKYVDICLKQEEEDEERIEDTELFDKFINVYKEDVVDCKKDIIQQVEALINNDLLFSNLNAYIDKLLETYRALSPLRVLEVKEHSKAIKLINLLFEQAIIRFNPDIDEECEKYGMGDTKVFLAMIGALDSLCTFAVTNNLHRAGIVNVIQFNARLPLCLAEYIADIIDDNFEQLKTKVIIKKLFS